MSTNSIEKIQTPRQIRRRERTRQHIVATAAEQFARRGVRGIRLDELADIADVARGTLYNHFRTKDDLLQAIIAPVLQLAAAHASQLTDVEPRQAVLGLIDMYLQLWRDHQYALRVAFQRQDAMPEPLAGSGQEYSRAVVAIFESAGRAGILRAAQAQTAAFTLRRVAVPLLETFASELDDGALFRGSVSGLLLSVPLDMEVVGRPPAQAESLSDASQPLSAE